MLEWSFFCCLFFVVTSCSILVDHNQKVLAPMWNHNIQMLNMDELQKVKIRTAANLIKSVVTSEEFKKQILNHTYNGQKAFKDNKGLSNLEIYTIIQEGAETLSPEKNSTMDVEIELFHEKTTTIGYTYPHTGRVWMNTKYFDRYTPILVADNLMHEWMHKLGFEHEFKWSRHREHSVPYAVGYLIKKLSKQHLHSK